jgi:uncharacterized protein YegP (UPF0339 family)
MGAFEILPSQEDEKYFYHYKASNGEVLFHSQNYDSKANAQRGVDDFIMDFLNAEVVDQTDESD